MNWDGLDGQGNKVPGNTIFPPGTVKIELLSGEVHFPFLDVEKNPGGTIVTRINGNNPDNKLYWDDTDIPNIGIPSNPKRNLAGINSSINGHIWSNIGGANFGDDNGMDSWAYIPSTPLMNPVAFRILETDLEVVSITSNPSSICEGKAASFVVTVRNNGPDHVLGAKFHLDLPAGLTGTTVTPLVTVGTGLVSSSNLAAAAYDATLNLNNAAQLTFTINATVSTLPPAGFLAFKASIIRPADVTDPDATNPDAAVPTDPDQECNAAPSGPGCNNIKNVQITVNPALGSAPTTTVIQPTCAAATGSITITAPVGLGFTYSIDGITYQAGPVFANVIPGTYPVQVKNAGGCTSPVANITINPQPPIPAAPAANAVQPSCAVNTGSILVTAPLGIGLTYSIDGLTYQASSTFNGLIPGTYPLTVKDPAGCISNATSITINAAPAIPAAATATSTGATCLLPTGSITVTSPLAPGLMYSIDGINYQSAVLFSAVAPGDHQLTVKNIAGCISAPVVIKVSFPIPAPNITQIATTCAVPVGSIIVTVTDPANTYGIDGVYQASNTFTNLTPADYTITVKNSSGCISAPMLVRIAAPIEDPVITAIQPGCAVATGSISITNPAFSAGYSFSINGGTSFTASGSFQNLNPGNYQVMVRKDIDNCLSGIINVTIHPQPITPATPVTTLTQPSCGLASGSITVTAPLGSGWSYSINGIDYNSSPVFPSVTPGSYLLTVKNTAGCISPAASVLIAPQPATPIAATVTTAQPTCLLATGSITVTTPLGADLTYSINGIDYQAGLTFTGLIAGTYPVTVKNLAGCISLVTSAVIAPQPATPVAPTATTVQPTCLVATGSITLTAPLGAGLTYSIDGTTYQTGLTFTGLTAGTEA